MGLMESGVILVKEKTNFRWGNIEMFPEVSSSCMARCVIRFGRFLGQWSPPIAWDFIPEQVINPEKLRHHLIEGCLAYPNENQQSFPLYWRLSYAYWATVQYS